mmetsp:Transcript_12335/g.28947  ORF Transcript_12335/g.28947 Transcript_12335/m.28947 type:complete len:923 (+) Transcript_12335:157-2925(+)|eukprot:CAMPEP_0178415834 /NCGR_PEP_ID=MMETSP0689_2-20121128/23754_1 /TAXON_ID=160604 /ORGANISM="Amphidinium massartii, Strain CS-259" /LENGTH=922 /DNA_ID=CAMNT_0020037163 /DNA_START=79 /DNA_END=2847 /DNA_ORIENTATION=+
MEHSSTEPGDQQRQRQRLLHDEAAPQQQAQYGSTASTPSRDEAATQSTSVQRQTTPIQRLASEGSSSIHALARESTTLLESLAGSERSPRLQDAPWTPMARVQDEPPHEVSFHADTPRQDEDVEVQFGSPFFYVNKHQPQVFIDVFCLTPHTERCVIYYKTIDGRAKAGLHYEHQEGELVFEESVFCQQIAVRILDDGSWSTTHEFHLSMKAVEGCSVCRYLRTTRVRVVSHDVFPNNSFREDIEQGRLKGGGSHESLSHAKEVGLVLSYMMWNDHIPGVRWRVMVILLFDQIQNLYAFLLLSLEVYLIDVILSKDPKDKERLWLRTGPWDGKVLTACVLAFLYVSPMVILHLWDYVKVRWLAVGGMVRKNLQGQLFRRFINMREDIRHKVSPARVASACLAHSHQLTEGLDYALLVIQSFGRLVALFIFILYMNRKATVFVIFTPALAALWIFAGASKKSRTQREISKEETRLADYVVETAAIYQVVVGYSREEATGDYFSERLDLYGRTVTDAKLHALGDFYFNKWLHPLVVATYLVTNVHRVFAGYLSLGKFLAALRVLHQTSVTCESLYIRLSHLVDAVRPLEEITDLLNQPSVNYERHKISDMVQAETKAQLGLVPAIPQPFSTPKCLTSLPIELRNVTFAYGQDTILERASVAVKQGSMVAVVGKRIVGKHTLLRLLAGSICPTSGLVFVPAHVHNLLVTRDPVMLDGTLYDNLTFGVNAPMRALKRVKHIVRKLGIEAAIKEVEYMEAGSPFSASGETSPGPWQVEIRRAKTLATPTNDVAEEYVPVSMPGSSWKACLAVSELAKVHLARALVANPDVLVLHRPFGAYPAEEAAKIFEVVHQHVRNRGVESTGSRGDKHMYHAGTQDEAELGKPVTCFFTPQNLEQARRADVIWHVKDRGIRVVSPGEVTVDMLV